MKRKKVKSWKSDTVPVKNMILRMVSVRAETANDDDHSIEVVIASENPVERFDEERGLIYHEVLTMAGMRFRTERQQLPIVDSHDRSTTRNVFGSIREIHVDSTELVGRAFFARDKDSQDAYWKVKDGHITDFSITATPYDAQMIQRDQTYELNGKTIQGPAEIVLDWIPTDASLVAAGADETSTVRELLRAYEIPRQGTSEMIPDETLAKLREQGMPEDIENSADALDWMIKKSATPVAGKPDQPSEAGGMRRDDDDEDDDEDVERDTDVNREKDEIQNMDDVENMDDTDVDAAVERALKADTKRQREIRALCKKAGIKRALADTLCESRVSLAVAREKVLERMIDQHKPVGSTAGGERISFGESGEDKTRNAMRDGLIARALGSIATPDGSRREIFYGTKPAAGYQDFQRMTLMRMAERTLTNSGVNVDRMTPKDIAMIAMGHTPTINRMIHSGIMRAGDPAIHTTASFANLMLDAANKTLLAGYEEAPYTWSMWARQAPAVADFKAINRIRFSESPDLEAVAENDLYPETVLTDGRESYNVTKFGRKFTVTWETVVNDDLDAISRIPQMHGAAARRKQNKEVYGVVTANAAMSDSNALFSLAHNNVAVAGGLPSVATLNDAYTAMRTQKGLTGDAIINVQPAFLIVPASLEATAYQLIGSIADPTSGGTNEGNSNTLNIYGPNGKRRLTVVGEPELDGNSAIAWYLAAANSQIDTVELTFLQGEEAPVLESEWEFDRDVYKYKVRQTFGTKAIDWRGLYRNPGQAPA